MSFPDELAFLEDKLVDLSPALSPGVYFLIEDGLVVYVGQAIYPAARLRAHRDERRISFGAAWVLPVAREHLDVVEGEMIRMINPVFNRRRPHGKASVGWREGFKDGVGRRPPEEGDEDHPRAAGLRLLLERCREEE